MIISRTPLRVSFFGGTSDYPAYFRKHGGSVLSTTIDKYIWITCRHLPPFFEHRSRIVWSEIELVKDVPEIHHPSVRECLRFSGVREGVEIHYDGDLPAQSGTGSSSAFTVGLLNALNALKGRMSTKRALAQDAIFVEQEMVREVVGVQDQIAASFGGLNRIDVRQSGDFVVTPVILQKQTLDGLQRSLMLYYTGQSRTASEIAAKRVGKIAAMEDRVGTMRAMVDLSLDMLQHDDLAEFGRLLGDSWKLKRNLGPSSTTDTADAIYLAAMSAGAFGGKLLGAGGGGFFLLFVPPERQTNVRRALAGFMEVPFRFDATGSQIVYYAPTEPIADMWHQQYHWGGEFASVVDCGVTFGTSGDSGDFGGNKARTAAGSLQ